MTLALAGRLAVEGVFYSAILFVAAVSLYWPWWKSQIGWSITAKSIALALAILPAMLTYWFGRGVYREFPWLGWVAVGALVLIPPILAWRAVIIWHFQRRARNII